MDITIKSIPHESHRYETAGDYFTHGDGKIEVRISELSDWRYEFLVAIHELIESHLCLHREIAWERVDQFDKWYESIRPSGDTSEPGDDPRAPYREEHFFATNIERLVAAELGVDWKAYETEVESL